MTASNRTWKLQYASRPVFLWWRAGKAPQQTTGAVWDDTNTRVTRDDIARIAQALAARPLPWASILEEWSPVPSLNAAEQAIYGRALQSGARCGD